MNSIFEIDQFSLDKEWLEQPKMYFEYAKNLAESRRDLDAMKLELDTIDAGLDLDIRKEPDRYGIEKITESTVKSAIIVNDKHQEIEKKLIQQKYKVDIDQAGLYALDHRKKALENMVQLRLADYFSEPRLPKSVGKPIRKRKEHHDQEQA